MTPTTGSRVGDQGLEATWAGLDAIDNGILVWSADRLLVYVNEGFRRNCDLPVSLGMRYDEYAATVAHSREWIVPGDREQWARDAIRDFGITKEADYQFAAGNIIHVAQRPSFLGGMAVTFTDVTAVKRNERELREAKETAEETDEAKSRFLRAANHDLRQPLASLKILDPQPRPRTGRGTAVRAASRYGRGGILRGFVSKIAPSARDPRLHCPGSCPDIIRLFCGW